MHISETVRFLNIQKTNGNSQISSSTSSPLLLNQIIFFLELVVPVLCSGAIIIINNISTATLKALTKLELGEF